jgi:integrase
MRIFSPEKRTFPFGNCCGAGERFLMETPQILKCPECGSSELVKASKRYSNGFEIQRFLCKNCELRFSDPSSKRLNVKNNDKTNSQICAFEAKNLDTATEIKTVAGENGKSLQEAKGKILEFCLYLKRQNYCEETIRLNRIALKVLSERGANLFNTDSVKDVIAKQTWSSNRKRNVINAYALFLKLNKMSWEPPRCNVEESIPFIPTEQEIDALISSAPKKLSTFLLLLKETAMRRGEAKRIEWINVDSEKNTITLNHPEKHSNSRMWKVTPQLIAQLNALPKDSTKVFGDSRMDTLKIAFLRLRQKQAAKMQNPRLLSIGFHTLRHWKATTLYHRTKDPLYVRDFLGHKSIKNTERYVNIERKMFADYGDDEFTVKVTAKQEEATTYLEQGFDWVGVKDNLIFLRKRK